MKTGKVEGPPAQTGDELTGATVHSLPWNLGGVLGFEDSLPLLKSTMT